MQRIFGLALVLTGAFVLSAGISVAGASTKFSSTEEVTDNGSLVFNFEEGSLKRFASVDYQLDATAIVASPNFASSSQTCARASRSHPMTRAASSAP